MMADHKGSAKGSSMSSSSSMASASRAASASAFRSDAKVSGNMEISEDGSSSGMAIPMADQKADREKFYHQTIPKDDQIPTKDKDKFERCVDWLLENGARFPTLYLRKYTDNVRGVHAHTDVKANQQIVTIPLKCLIMENMGRKTEIGRKVMESNVHLTVPNHCQVIIYMLLTREQGNHFFQPYYDILPEDFNNFPIFWTDEEMSWLEGSELVNQIRERKANIRSDYDRICEAAPEFKRFDFNTFMWCRTAVGSRNFGIVVNGVKRTAMVPFADMLNHYRPRETSWTFNNTQQSFTVTTLKDMRVGQQVMDSYGKKCNSKFLMHYGFTIEVNREADGRCQNELCTDLRMPRVSEDDPHCHEMRLSLAPQSRRLRITMTFDDSATAEALSYCRIAVATDGELESILTARGGSTRSMSTSHSLSQNPVGPLSRRNEIAALDLLADACRVQLSKYPTTKAEDDELLAADKLEPFSNRKHAVIVVRGEKEICHFFIDLARITRNLLQDSFEEVLATVRSDFAGNGDTDRYLRSLVFKFRDARIYQ